ncbi:hypothetical protein BJ963_003375 [Leifsonia soli]|uniref:Uncharacterized protein n=1 Tax=Leifsonia soli TaxID=582665 RepID=A0A852T2I7_9MICO|nr:hypothetical protein [Leifsonia soli]
MTPYPYESQWGDIACNQPLIEQGTNPATFFDWRTDGYPSEQEYLFWSQGSPIARSSNGSETTSASREPPTLLSNPRSCSTV